MVKIIKKIILTITLIFLMFNLSNAVSLNTNQDDNTKYYLESDIAIINSIPYFGQDNYNYTYNNVTWVYDVRQFINYIDSPYYISFNNLELNSSWEIHLTSVPDIGEPVTTTYSFNAETLGDFHFKVLPSYTGENIRIEINAPENSFGDIRFTTTKNNNLELINSVTDTFIVSTTDLININIGFWKMLYYLFIFVIILSSLGLLISFSFGIYDWAESISTKKSRVFKGGK